MPQLVELGNWLGLSTCDDGQHDQRALKSRVTERGVNARGWRLYLDHGDAMFKPFADSLFKTLSPQACAAQAMAWLCVLQACQMDVLPPRELVNSIAQWDLPAAQLQTIPPMFLRAAWKATTAIQYEDADVDAPDFVDEAVVPLAQWFFRSGAYKTTGSDRLKAGWDSLKRLRRDSMHKQASELSSADWPSVIQKYASGPFVMIGLSHESDLEEEGEAMDHCVGSYADTCRFEPVRIYSIRRKKCGTRIATLSVRETKPGCWAVDQLKGPSNAEVGPLLWPEIVELLHLMNTASQHDAKLRRYLDFIHQLAAA